MDKQLSTQRNTKQRWVTYLYHSPGDHIKFFPALPERIQDDRKGGHKRPDHTNDNPCFEPPLAEDGRGKEQGERNEDDHDHSLCADSKQSVIFDGRRRKRRRRTLTRATEDQAANLKALRSFAGSNSSSSSSTDITSADADSRFSSISTDAGFGLSDSLIVGGCSETGALIARVISKLKSSGHCDEKNFVSERKFVLQMVHCLRSKRKHRQ